MFCGYSKRKRWMLTYRVHIHFFFEFLKKIKLNRLFSWINKPIWLEILINWFLIKNIRVFCNNYSIPQKHGLRQSNRYFKTRGDFH